MSFRRDCRECLWLHATCRTHREPDWLSTLRIDAGWPAWLHDLVEGIREAAGHDERTRPRGWYRQLCAAFEQPVDYASAFHRFLAGLLESVREADTAGVVEPVMQLHRRAIVGDEPTIRDWNAAAARAAIAINSGSTTTWPARVAVHAAMRRVEEASACAAEHAQYPRVARLAQQRMLIAAFATGERGEVAAQVPADVTAEDAGEAGRKAP